MCSNHNVRSEDSLKLLKKYTKKRTTKVVEQSLPRQRTVPWRYEAGSTPDVHKLVEDYGQADTVL